jgi:hypothetical protein
VGVQGVTPIQYQWQLNGTNLPGATNQTLTIPDVKFDNFGVYSAMASNAFATVSSKPAALRLQNIMIWGNRGIGATNVPVGLTNAIAIGAGEYFFMALRSDGNIFAWGDKYYSPTNLPYGLSDVMAIAAGKEHGLALKANGTVVPWGQSSAASVPVGLSNVVDVAAGRYHNLALKWDGTVVNWGNSLQVGLNLPAWLKGVIAVAAGEGHSLALRSDGTIVAWGDNYYGQTNIPAGLSQVVDIAAGSAHSLALRADGTVVAWGANDQGQTNVPSGLKDVVAIACGRSHNLALRADGTVAAWGGDSAGQRSLLPKLGNVAAIAASTYTSMALVDYGPPVFFGRTTQREVPAGGNLRLSVTARGDKPMTYQWRHNGVDLPGMTNRFFIATNLQFQQSGPYSVVVCNAAGSTTNVMTALTVADSATVKRLRVGAWAENNLRFTIATEVGKTYSLEYSLEIMPLDWKPMGAPTVGKGNPEILSDPTPTNGHKWYRLKVE